MGIKFGTDGIRGEYGAFPLQPDIIEKLGYAVAMQVPEDSKILLGYDTRESSPEIANKLISGIKKCGRNIIEVKIMPTPAISYLTLKSNAKLGIAITASHNPYTDNGIKIFNSKGSKLDENLERKIEMQANNLLNGIIPRTTNSSAYKFDESALANYSSHLISSINTNGLSEISAAFDCANGAASPVMQLLVKQLPLNRVYLTGINPNGTNINEGFGSIYPQTISSYTKARNADVGFSFDGDADRLVVCDEKGNIINGDLLLAMIAKNMQEDGNLSENSLVVTEYSNLALDKYLKRHNINTIRVSNGDKFVSRELARNGYNFGGEFSGHIIFKDHAKSGDGILSALKVLEIMAKTQKPISELTPKIELNPQIIENVKLKRPIQVSEIPGLDNIIAQLSKEIGNDGRILVRNSGTEPKIRVMVEHPDEYTAKNTTKMLTELINNHNR